MSLGQINLSELYKFDELYWIPSDKAESMANHLEIKEVLPKNDIEVTAPMAAAVEINYPAIATPWVVLGHITDQEKQILKLAFSASPLGLTDTDWSVVDLQEIPETFTDFIEKTEAKKYVFLGKFIDQVNSKLPKDEFLVVADSKVLIFPRLISSLNDSEKHLKLAFWNHLKALV